MSTLAPGFDPLIAEAKSRARQRRLLVVAALALALTAGAMAFGVEHWKLGIGSRASTPLPTLLGNTGLHYARAWVVRPSEIVNSGDGVQIIGGFVGDLGKARARNLGDLKWVAWTQESAIGHGALWVNDCIPYCARGRYVARPVTVEAFRPVEGRFSRLKLTFALQGGGRYTETLVLSHDHSFWQ